MSQNPPDDPFGSKPSEDPFGKPPEDPGPQSAADIWRRASEQREQQQQPPPPPPAPAYGPPDPYAAPPGQWAGPPVGARKADGATASLVLGILGVVICGLCAPFAWSLGRKAERQVDASGGTLAGRGEATAGKVLGMIGTAFLVLIVVGFIAIVAFGLALDSSSTTTEFQEF